MPVGAAVGVRVQVQTASGNDTVDRVQMQGPQRKEPLSLGPEDDSNTWVVETAVDRTLVDAGMDMVGKVEHEWLGLVSEVTGSHLMLDWDAKDAGSEGTPMEKLAP